MCRWFAYISPSEPALLSDVLINPTHSITRQCSEKFLPYLVPHSNADNICISRDARKDLYNLRHDELNMDGIGLAWYTPYSTAYTSKRNGMRPAVYKSASPPTSDLNFTNICANTESYCVLAHIRASSGSAVTAVNNHPFIFGRHAFMHNGKVNEFTRVRLELSSLIAFDAYESIVGSSDSEHCAALYMTFLTKGGTKESWERSYTLEEMKNALVKTVVTILEVQKRVFVRGDKDLRVACSLNFCATDGNKMVACRVRNHPTDLPPSLYWSEFAGRKLNRKYPGNPDNGFSNPDQLMTDDAVIGRHTIIASEPTTYDEQEWNQIAKNHMVLVDEYGKETDVPLDYDPALDAPTQIADAMDDWCVVV